MARRYHRRNPAEQVAHLLPLVIAFGGIYILAKSVKPTAAGPVQGLGSIFSNVLKTIEKVSKDTVVAPLQVALRVAAAPIKLATGSSWSSVRNSIEAPGKSTVADIQSASPSSIKPQAQQSQAAAPLPTTYLDANGNQITQQQYDGLMFALGLQPAADIPGGTLQVPPSADPDFTQSSNSVVQNGSAPGAPGQGGAAPKSAVNPWMVGGTVIAVPALMYFMHK